MSKKLLIVVVFFIIYFFNIDEVLNKFVNSLLLDIRDIFKTSFTSINSYYFSLADANKKIIILQDKIEKLKLNAIKTKILKNDKNNIDLLVVEPISYTNFNDFSKIFVDIKDINVSNKILPLIDNNSFACGIIKIENNQFVAYFQSNKQSNYTVFIGKHKAPGVTYGYSKDGFLLVKYTPIFYKIDINDSVVTSGFDNIFRYGIKVGVVTKVKKLEDDTYLVFIKPYCNINNNKFYTLTQQSKSK